MPSPPFRCARPRPGLVVPAGPKMLLSSLQNEAFHQRNVVRVRKPVCFALIIDLLLRRLCIRQHRKDIGCGSSTTVTTRQGVRRAGASARGGCLRCL
jgi:hypothetical protein